VAKTLVTGGAGFIGSHLCESLLRRGEELVVVDNFDSFYPCQAKRSNIRAIEQSGSIRFYERDIRDQEGLNAIFSKERPDAVIHLAARAGVRDSIQAPQLYVDINVNGTLNVLEAMRQNGVTRLVFGSSSSVYGGVRETPFREDQPTVSICPYAATKAAGEGLCSTYSEIWGFSIVCCRFFTVYGPRQRPDMAISRFARAIAARQPITIYGDGSSARDYTFVADIVDGIVRALDVKCKFEIVNLGSTRPIRLSQLIEVLAKNLNAIPEIKYAASQPGEPYLTLADISKATKLLGYLPATQFEEGIREFVLWDSQQVQAVSVTA
jgi:UDP-glucuronate 4-epimerase